MCIVARAAHTSLIQLPARGWDSNRRQKRNNPFYKNLPLYKYSSLARGRLKGGRRLERGSPATAGEAFAKSYGATLRDALSERILKDIDEICRML